ncbi:PepSY domain-containing protein [Oceanicoccus sp. KOV_DT_Chl]|uniref:PepSY domain-containing protein n=1 Tax=Oceanicoccus sp. KOV_DT_Chl TaxID=1904639 RepID=UPI000C7A88AB|nr:PepSY domain-containing protein [Oceanicoccus sp. KOV_DT_Chl]
MTLKIRHSIINKTQSLLLVLSQLILINFTFANSLTEQQVIQQAERLFNGRVVTLTPNTDKNIFIIRLLTDKAKIILIEADAVSGNMQRKNFEPTLPAKPTQNK